MKKYNLIYAFLIFIFLIVSLIFISKFDNKTDTINWLENSNKLKQVNEIDNIKKEEFRKNILEEDINKITNWVANESTLINLYSSWKEKEVIDYIDNKESAIKKIEVWKVNTFKTRDGWDKHNLLISINIENVFYNQNMFTDFWLIYETENGFYNIKNDNNIEYTYIIEDIKNWWKLVKLSLSSYDKQELLKYTDFKSASINIEYLFVWKNYKKNLFYNK